MVRKKVRARSLLLKNKNHMVRKENKNSILTFQNIPRVRKKIRTRFLIFKKKNPESKEKR